VVSLKLPIIVLMLSLSSATSPRAVDLDRTGQVALGDGRSPLRQIARTWGRQIGREQVLTLPVKSFHVPAAPGHVGLAAEAAFDAHFACDARDLIGKRRQGVGHVVDGLGKRCDLGPSTSPSGSVVQVAVGDRGSPP